jgi:hypothetical protein
METHQMGICKRQWIAKCDFLLCLQYLNCYFGGLGGGGGRYLGYVKYLIYAMLYPPPHCLMCKYIAQICF